jgi:hypothetical protein
MRNIDPNKAVDFLLEHAEKYAKAKANRIQIEEFRKSKKALLMNQCSAETVNAREQYAYSHSEYIQLIEGLKEAVEIEESLKWKMTAAQMRVEIWRSLEATSRAEGRAVQ